MKLFQRSSAARRVRPAVRLFAEPLDARALPSVMLAGSVVNVLGTHDADNIQVTVEAGQLKVTLNDQDSFFNLSDVELLHIAGKGGNDTITVTGDVSVDAFISAGRGDDSVDAGGGDDTIHGNGGDDSCSGGDGNDVLSGNAGDDSLDGGAGDDKEDGNVGNDDLLGGSDNDTLQGGSGDDAVDGEDGDDWCKGGSGDDTCDGGQGDDDLDGGDGQDQVDGGGGNDHLAGVHVGFHFEQDQDQTVHAQFQVEIDDALPCSAYDVLIDGVVVAHVDIDSYGHGELKYCTEPDEWELLFPDSFPELGVHSSVTVENQPGSGSSLCEAA